MLRTAADDDLLRRRLRLCARSSQTSARGSARIDLALLPIGAYEPRWFMHAVHMNPAEAVQAHLDLGAPSSIGMHFGTFQLTDRGRSTSHSWLLAAPSMKEVFLIRNSPRSTSGRASLYRLALDGSPEI